jgi:hypothetical protein
MARCRRFTCRSGHWRRAILRVCGLAGTKSVRFRLDDARPVKVAGHFHYGLLEYRQQYGKALPGVRKLDVQRPDGRAARGDAGAPRTELYSRRNGVVPGFHRRLVDAHPTRYRRLRLLSRHRGWTLRIDGRAGDQLHGEGIRLRDTTRQAGDGLRTRAASMPKTAPASGR